MPQKVLIIGGGGREHALAWKIAQSPKVRKIYVAPGNGGTAAIAENVSIAVTDIEKLARFAKEKKIDLTVVGPDEPLALGIVDYFQEKGLRIFGPTKAAAEIEWSKAFAKQFMQEEGIPTAKFGIFHSYDEALAYLREVGAPIVVKASGLALGKGVYVCKTIEEAVTALQEIIVHRAYANAGDEVVIEEFLEGQEISIHAFCDGKTAVLFPAAQDHKTIFDGDRGPNTGGMGTYAPVPWVTDELLEEIKKTIVMPTLYGLARRGRPFVGCLFPGLIITRDGPKVLEFNARFGDPETQTYMRLLKTDLMDIIEACIDGYLSDYSYILKNIRIGKSIEWMSGFAACVVLASGGYPRVYKKGIPIYGLEQKSPLNHSREWYNDKIVIFHAGTEERNGQLVTAGGRVLGVTANGETLQTALDCVYEGARLIHFDGMQFRRDIGAKALSVDSTGKVQDGL